MIRLLLIWARMGSGSATSSVFVSCFLGLLVLLVVQKASSDCTDCFVSSKASFYSSQDGFGTSSGACGYGVYGSSLNGGRVSCAANLYRNGSGCGACYQVKCTDSNLCTDNGVTVVVTDMGKADNGEFILSNYAFSEMARTTDTRSNLAAQGVVDILYRRISCQYPGQNLALKIDESSNFPSYLAFLFWFQGGSKDIRAVQICETVNLQCKLVRSSHGAIWDVVSAPSGDMSVRILVGDDDNEQWLTVPNVIPSNWTAGAIIDTGLQLQD